MLCKYCCVGMLVNCTYKVVVKNQCFYLWLVGEWLWHTVW